MAEKGDLTPPLVTVVIPTYNHAQFIGRAIQSVIDQSYKNWELIIINNCSTDNTVEIIGEFTDRRISVQDINNDGVIACSRNLGMRLAKGKWIAFLDSDDWWYPSRLEVALIASLSDSTANIICTNEDKVIRDSKKLQYIKYGPYVKNFYRNLFFCGNCLSPSSTLIKTDFIKSNELYFREVKQFATAEDYDYWLLLAKAGANFKFLNSAQGAYLVHSANQSGSDRFHRAILSVLKDHAHNYEQLGKSTEYLERYITTRVHISNAMKMINQSQGITGLMALFSAIINNPKQAITFIGLKLKRKLGILYLSYCE